LSQIILDFGSGNTCKNESKYIKRMYDELKKIDTHKHEVIIKWQLFSVCGGNIPLTKECFEYACYYGDQLGYKTTSSVFDRETLKYLLLFDVPFVKIPNRRHLDYLIDLVPEHVPVYVSKSSLLEIQHEVKNIEGYGCFSAPRTEMEQLWCISKYPAQIRDYEKLKMQRYDNISDHTNSFDLFYRYEPKIIEWHYKLKDSTGLDASEFARTPEQLKEIL